MMPASQPSQIVTRYLLTHYVSVCQRFNFAMAESDYTECGAFHYGMRNQLWYAQWKRSNPESPLNLYKDGTVVQATVTSVTFLKEADARARDSRKCGICGGSSLRAMRPNR